MAYVLYCLKPRNYCLSVTPLVEIRIDPNAAVDIVQYNFADFSDFKFGGVYKSAFRAIWKFWFVILPGNESNACRKYFKSVI